MKDLSAVTIETDRLMLVPVSLDHVDDIMRELTEDITKYMAFYPPKSREDEVDYVNGVIEKMKRGSDLVLSILHKETREYLGSVGLHKINTKAPELGIWVKAGSHGKKIGRESVSGVRTWADANLDFDFLVYPVDRNNIPSRKIPESLGGIVVLEEKITSPFGKELDEVVYHIPKL
jgi:[ribosomal protein S5]-alanine N-acetyltransferase